MFPQSSVETRQIQCPMKSWNLKSTQWSWGDFATGFTIKIKIIITAKFWKLLLEVCIGKYNIWNKHLLLLLQSICRHVLNIENHFRPLMSSRKVVKMHEVACRYMYFHTVRRRVTPNMTNMFGSCILQTAIIIGQFSVVTVT